MTVCCFRLFFPWEVVRVIHCRLSHNGILEISFSGIFELHANNTSLENCPDNFLSLFNAKYFYYFQQIDFNSITTLPHIVGSMHVFN